MKLHNLGTVLGFEVRRTLTKPSFWLTSLSIPLLMVVIFALMFWSNSSALSSVDTQRGEKQAFTYADSSGLVSPTVAAEMGGTRAPDATAAAQAVREGRAEVHLDIPADPTREAVHIVAEDVGLIQSGQWHALARDLLERSASERIGDSRLVGVLTGVSTDAELWKDGHRSPGLAAAVVPGLFLVLLYMGVLMLGQQMLNITVEEKENRVTEMILTTLDPRVLIVGKVLAVFAVGIVQAMVLLVPAVLVGVLFPGLLGAATAGPGNTLPADEMPPLALGGEVLIDPVRIVLAALIFTGGFLMFTGLLVAIGSIMPTAKDAGSAFGAVILAMFLPLYTAAMVINDPTSVVSEFLTWFPLTAPVTALLRNALGLLPVWQGVAVALVLFAFASALVWLGVRLFRQGSISYDKRLSVGKALRASRSRPGS